MFLAHFTPLALTSFSKIALTSVYDIFTLKYCMYDVCLCAWISAMDEILIIGYWETAKTVVNFTTYFMLCCCSVCMMLVCVLYTEIYMVA